MTNIYNKFTKKTKRNVKWAPKGKFWYIKGKKAKYFPKNGWKKSGYKRSGYRRYSR